MEDDKEKLVPTSKLIDLAKGQGIDLGKGGPNERLRYYTKLGLIPHAQRKIDPADSRKTVGHYPLWVLDRLQTIEKLRSQGFSAREVKERLKAKEPGAVPQEVVKNLTEPLTASIEDLSEKIESAQGERRGEFLRFAGKLILVFLLALSIFAVAIFFVPKIFLPVIQPIQDELRKITEKIQFPPGPEQPKPAELPPGLSQDAWGNIENLGLSAGSFDLTAQNVIRNSSFEANDLGTPRLWTYYNESTSANTFVTQEGYRTGGNGLKFQGSAGSPYLGVYQPEVKTDWTKPYSLSAWIKVLNAPSITIRLGFWDKPNNRRVETKEFTISGTQDWQRLTQTADNRGTYIGKDWFPLIEVYGLSSGSVYIDDVQLEESAGPTLYHALNGSILGDGSITTDEAGNLYPTQDAIGELGKSGGRWRKLQLFKASINEEGTLDLSGNASVAGSFSTGSVNSHLVPNRTSTYDLGSSTYYWRNLYVDSITGGSSFNCTDCIDFDDIADSMTLDANLAISASASNYSINIDSGTFYVDTANNRIGLGDTTPAATLTVGSGDLFQVDGSTGNITTSGDLAVNGGDITTTATTWNFDLPTSGGTIYFRDGTNTLCSIADAGTTGNLTCTGNITGSSSGTVGFWSRSGTTLSPATANDIVSIANTTTTGADLAITNTGVYTGTGLVSLTANSATSGDILALSATSLTTGSLLTLTGPSGGVAGVTDAALKITSDVGNIGTSNGLISSTATIDSTAASSNAINLYLSTTNSPSTNANTAYGAYSTLTDATALANTLYGIYSTVNNSSNTSTGTHSIYGGYFTATGKTAGTTTAYGIYATASGADTNLAGYFGGNVRINTGNANMDISEITDAEGIYQQIAGLGSGGSAELQFGRIVGGVNYDLYIAAVTNRIGGTLEINYATGGLVLDVKSIGASAGSAIDSAPVSTELDLTAAVAQTGKAWAALRSRLTVRGAQQVPDANAVDALVTRNNTATGADNIRGIKAGWANDTASGFSAFGTKSFYGIHVIAPTGAANLGTNSVSSGITIDDPGAKLGTNVYGIRLGTTTGGTSRNVSLFIDNTVSPTDPTLTGAYTILSESTNPSALAGALVVGAAAAPTSGIELDVTGEIQGSSSIAASGVGQFGGTTTVAYNRFGTATAGGANIGASNDLLISDGLEVDGTLYLDGTTVSAANVTTFNCTDCIDFDDLEDTLDLDAALTLNQTTNTWTQSFTGTTTTGFSYTGSALTSGILLDLANTSTLATSADLIQGDHTATYTTTATLSGNLLDLSRALTTNTGGALTVTGAVATISDNCTVTAGSCTNSANVLSLTQSYASASGATLNISNSGTGADIAFNTSPILRMSDAGTMTWDDGTNTLAQLVDNGTTGDLVITGIFQVGSGTTRVAYNRLGSATAGGANIGAANDLLISDSLEVDGTLYLDGTTVSAANVTTFNCTDCIDFDDLADSMTLDANLAISASASNYSINIDSNTLFVDTANNRVGIGTAAPSQKLDIVGDVEIEGDDGWNSIGDLAILRFGALGNDNGIYTRWGGPGMTFAVYKTGGGGTIGTNSLDAMTIEETTGDVGIGTTSPGARLHVSGTGAGGLNGTPVLTVNRTDTTAEGPIFNFQLGGTTYISATANSGDWPPGSSGAVKLWLGYGGSKEGQFDFWNYRAFGGVNTYDMIWTTKGLGNAFVERMKLTGNAATSNVIFSSSNVGIGDTGPDAKLEILATTEQLRLTYTDDTVDSRFTVSSTGDLTIDLLGGGTTEQLILADTDVLNIGGSGSTDVAYNVIGDSTSGASASMDSDDDLYIEGNLEVDGTIIGASTFNCTDCIDADDLADTLDFDAASETSFTLTANNATTQSVFTANTNGLTTGTNLTLASTATALSSGRLLFLNKTGASGSTAFTGDIANLTYSQTFNGGVGLDSTGNVLDISRSITLDNLGNTHTVSGALLTISDSGTQTNGTLTWTGDTVRIAQNYANTNAAALNITTASTDTGTSNFALRVNDDGTFTDSTPFVVDEAGNVGIGLTSPGYALDVVGNRIRLRASTAGGAKEMVWRTDGSQLDVAFSNADMFWGSSTGHNFVLQNDGGNVGIGDTTPAALFVVGSGEQFTVTSAGVAAVGLNNTATANGICHSGANVDVATDTTRDLVACSGAPSDIAEFYETEAGVGEGDVVMTTDQSFTYQSQGVNALTGELEGKTTRQVAILGKATSEGKDRLIGVVSSDPYQVFGRDIIYSGAHNPQPIALNGRVPVKVSLENGPIEVGDSLTSSSTAGVAMRATKAGRVIGMALEPFDGAQGDTPGVGKILVFVNISYYVGDLNELGLLLLDEPEQESRPLPSLFEQVVKLATESAKLATQSAELAPTAQTATPSATQNTATTSSSTTFKDALVSQIIKTLKSLGITVKDAIVSIKEAIIEKLTVKELAVDNKDSQEPLLGEAKIPTGEKEIKIQNAKVKDNSKVFVTFRGKPQEIGWAVKEIKTGEYFIIEISRTLAEDLIFDYWIVGSTAPVNLKPENGQTPPPSNQGVTSPEPTNTPEPTQTTQPTQPEATPTETPQSTQEATGSATQP